MRRVLVVLGIAAALFPAWPFLLARGKPFLGSTLVAWLLLVGAEQVREVVYGHSRHGGSKAVRFQKR